MKNFLRTAPIGVCFVIIFSHITKAQFPYTETFRNATAPGMVFGGAPSAALTAPGIDTDGNGYLRLTNNITNQHGYVYNNTATFPSNYGVDVTFEYFTYGGTGADGVSFFLFDAATTNFNLGSFGGSLGYAPGCGHPGLTNGYAGIGFDEYGNFSNTSDCKTGGPGFRKNAVAIRGSAANNYPYIDGAQTVPAFTVAGDGAVRSADSTNPGYRKAHILMSVRPGGGYNVTVAITRGGVPPTTTTVLSSVPLTHPAPARFKFGLAGATGASTNYHEIRNLHITVDPSAALVNPVAGNDNGGEVCTGLSKTIHIISNDTSKNEGGEINPATVDLDTATAGIQNSFTNAEGAYTANTTTGELTFTAANGFTGPATIAYVVNDNYGKASSPANISFNVVPPPSTAVAGPDQVQCNTSTFTMAANTPTAGAGQWSVVNGAATIADTSSATTTVTITSGSSATLRWTISNANCAPTSSEVTLTLCTPAQQCGPPVAFSQAAGTVCSGANASLDVSLPANSYADYYFQLQKRASGATDWTNEGAVVSNGVHHQYTFTIANAQPGFEYRSLAAGGQAEINSANCRVASNPTELKVTGFTTGVDTASTGTVCYNTAADLTATVTPKPGSGTPATGYTYTWETSAGGSTGWSVITGQTGATLHTDALTADQYYRVTAAVNGCTGDSVSQAFKVTVDSPVTANAGPDQTQYNTGSFSMAANQPTVGTGQWSVVSGNATIADPANPATTITIAANTSATLRWTIISNNTCPSASDDVEITWLQQADLSVTKTSGSDTVSAGQTINYTIRVTNAGPSNAMNVAITDNVPPELQNVSWTAISSGTGTSVSAVTGTGNVNIISNIPAGADHVVTIIINGTVDPAYTGNSLRNWATATLPGKPPLSGDTVHTHITIDPGVQILKSGPDKINAGAPISYTLSVSNNGPSNAHAVAIADIAPPGLQHVTWTAIASGTGTTVSAGNDTGNVNITGDIPAGPGHVITITIQGTVDPAYTGNTLSNTATANTAGKPPVSSTVTTTVNKVCDLQIVKSGPQQEVAGQWVTYTIQVTNTGPGDATGASIRDIIPAELLDVFWTAATNGNGTTISAVSGTGNNIAVTGNIPAGSGHNITIVVNGRLDPGTISAQVRNTATATPPPGTTDPTPATSTTVIHMRREADLVIVKTGPADKAAGQAIAYRLVITNNGPSDVTDVSIQDLLPATVMEITYSSAVTGAAKVTGIHLNDHTLTVTGNIAAGSGNSIIVDIKAQVSPGMDIGTITNTGTVTPPPGITETDPATNTSSITTNINTNVGLQVSKSGPAQANAGDTITYTVEVTNTGTTNAVGVQLLDNVPADITHVTWSAIALGNDGTTVSNSGGIGNGINMTANIEGTTDGPGKIVLTINGIIATEAASTVTNIATVEYAGTKQSSFTTAINHTADLRISKAGPDAISSGQQITYSIDVTNAGPADAEKIIIADTVPEQIQQVKWTVAATGNATTTAGSGTGNAIAVNANIPAGADNSIRITVTGIVDPAYTGVLTNTVTATPPTGTPDPTPATSTITTKVNQQYDLQIVKGGPAQVAAGQLLTYTVTVINNGPSNAGTVTISDIVPPQLQNVTWMAVASGTGTSITSNSSGSGNNIHITGSIMAGNGHQLDLTISGTVNASFAGIITNTTTATAPDGTTESSSVNTVVNNNPGLQIVKSGPSNINAGQNIVYTIAVTNQGPSDARAITVSDVIPAQIQQVTWTAVATGTGARITGNSSGNGNNVVINGDLAAGADTRINITVNGIVDAAFQGTLSNTASVTPNGGTPVNSTPVVTTVDHKTGLLINKSAPSAALANDSITYIIRVSNTGPSTAMGAIITDHMPAGVHNISWTSTVQGKAAITNGATGTGPDISVTGNIPAGAGNMITITITGKVSPRFSGPLKNVAMVTPPNGPPVTTDTSTTNVQRYADISVVKSGPDKAMPGEGITYTIDVSNTGPGDADTVTVTDLVPAGIIVNNWSVAIIKDASTLFGPSNGTGNDVRVQAALSNGGQLRITINGTVQATATGIIHNIAKATLSKGIIDPSPDDTSSVTTEIPFVNEPVSTDLVVQQRILSNAPYQVGQRVDYNITVHNQGPDIATGILVTDVLPANLGVPTAILADKGSARYDAAGKTILWNIGAMPVGANGNLTYHVQLTGSGNLVNTALVHGTEEDPDSSSNQSVSTISVTGDLFIPNTITPNGDGKNDKFIIPGLEKYPGSLLEIYNRWGNQVYQANNYSNNWDGTGLAEGTYYYILKVKQPAGEKAYKGWIELLR